MRGFEIAPFDYVDQGARCRFGSHAKLGAQQIREQFDPAQCGFAALVVGQQLQRSTLSILTRRLESNQPLSARNGALTIAIRIGVAA